MTMNEMIEILINDLNVSPETIDCVTFLYGEDKQSCENILFWKTGKGNFDIFLETKKAAEAGLTIEEYRKEEARKANIAKTTKKIEKLKAELAKKEIYLKELEG